MKKSGILLESLLAALWCGFFGAMLSYLPLNGLDIMGFFEYLVSQLFLISFAFQSLVIFVPLLAFNAIKLWRSKGVK